MAKVYLQEKLTGTEGQIVGFNAEGNAEAQDALASVLEHIGDKDNPHNVTAAQTGAVPVGRTVNGKALSADITLAAGDVGADAAGTAAAAVGAHNGAADAHGSLFAGKADADLSNVDNAVFKAKAEASGVGKTLKAENGKEYEPVFVSYPNTYEKLGVNGYYSPDGTKVFSILNSSTSGFTLKCTTPDGTEIYSSDIAYSTSGGTWDLITYIDDKYLGICQGTGKACWVSYTDTGAQFVSACATGSTPNYTRSDIKGLYLSDLYRSPDYMIAGNYKSTNSQCYLYSRTDGSALGQITMSSVNVTSFGLCVTPENVAYCMWINSRGDYSVHQGVLSGISLSTSQLFTFNSGYSYSYNSQIMAASIYFYDNHLYIVVTTGENTYELRKYDTSGTLVASLSINNGSRAFIGHYLICGTSMYDLDTMSQITSPSYYGPYMTLNSSSYTLGTGSIGYAFLKPLTASRGVVVSTSALPFLSSNGSPYACYFRGVD